MQLKIFKLKFRTPLHIGDNRPNYESCEGFIHSDTLFSALINAWRLLYPEDLALFFPPESPESLDFPYFRLSSAFPYLGDELFFPKPAVKLPLQNDPDQRGLVKLIKNLSWLSKTRFEDCLAQRPFEIKAENLIGEKFLSVTPWRDKPAILTIADSPRIIKDRISEQTDIFYFSRLYFGDNAGLFFLAEIQEEWLTKIKTVLNLLGDEGIGGDRSVGQGLFKVAELAEIDLQTPDNADHFLTLSLYHPKSSELSNIMNSATYDLITRSGWVYSGRGHSLRRNAVRMFREGSVFSGKAGNYGDVVKVLDPLPERQLDHAVYRYGQALALPVIVPAKEEV